LLNKCILMGRLTQSPELKYTPSNVAVCSFKIAVDRRFKQDEADFISCVAWRQAAEFICKHFEKGKMINVVGRIETRSWEKDGQKRYATEVLVEEVNFCGDKQKQEGVPVDDTGFIPVEDDPDLPF
jgi:single-strand DNA-binding protein